MNGNEKEDAKKAVIVITKKDGTTEIIEGEDLELDFDGENIVIRERKEEDSK